MNAAARPIELKGRNQPDRSGAQSHAAERNQERIFAADAIAHPAKQEGPQRTDQETGGEQRDGAEQRRDGVALFEEFDRQDRGQAAEDIEIIPLDDVSPRCRDDHASEVLRNMSSHGHPPLPFGAVRDYAHIL